MRRGFLVATTVVSYWTNRRDIWRGTYPRAAMLILPAECTVRRTRMPIDERCRASAERSGNSEQVAWKARVSPVLFVRMQARHSRLAGSRLTQTFAGLPNPKGEKFLWPR